jgi:hypothetical protein
VINNRFEIQTTREYKADGNMGCNMSVVYDWTGRGMISGEVFAVS